jgi:hypothetical protein
MAVTEARVQVRNQHRYFPSKKEGFQNDLIGTSGDFGFNCGGRILFRRGSFETQTTFDS